MGAQAEGCPCPGPEGMELLLPQAPHPSLALQALKWENCGRLTQPRYLGDSGER